jgi:hypothetical protein
MSEYKTILYIVCLLVINSCRLTDNDKPEPFYLELKNPVVKQPFGTENDTHKMTDVWVFINGQIIGVFPLPARVPVTYDGGNAQVTILAGIRKNGMLDNPVFYPFYQAIEKTIAPKVNETITIPLDFKYVPNAKIPIFEGFETAHCFSLDIDGVASSYIGTTGQDAALGASCGKITLTTENSYVAAACATSIKKSETSKGQSYLELDYKGEGEIAVGISKLQGNTSKLDYFLYIPGKENWNKIYIDLTDKLSPQDFSEYFIVISASKKNNSQQSVLYIDNIKHIYF